MRVALLGAGYLGRFHGQKLKSLCENEFKGRARFVGLFDTSEERARTIGSELQTKCFSSFAELKRESDAVVVATITSAHYSVARDLLQSGLHCNVEKPLTESLNQSKELAEIAHQKKLVLNVGMSERYSPAVNWLMTRQRAATHFELTRQSTFSGRAGDTSVIHDLMIHDLDILQVLCSGNWQIQSFESGAVLGEHVDWATVRLKNEKGTTALIRASRLAAKPERRIRVISQERAWEVDSQAMEAYELNFQGITKPIACNVFKLEKADQLYLEDQAFLAAVIEGQKAPISANEVIPSMALIEAMLKWQTQ